MKVLVLGAAGMAGHVVSIYLKEQGLSVDTLSARNKLDDQTQLINVYDLNKFESFLSSRQYDAVINCVGLLVKESEERKDRAVYLNSFLPHYLENYYKEAETKVVSIGSDGVFSGKASPYKEDAYCDAQSFYGRTKALGEIVNNKDLTFRTSIIGPDMSRESASLFNWFYSQKGEVSGYTNVAWGGVTTLELAKAIRAALDQSLSGLYHLVPKNSISKFELLELLKETFERNDIVIKPTKGTGINNGLTNTRRDFDYQIPSYKSMVQDMKSWIENHRNLYEYYES